MNKLFFPQLAKQIIYFPFCAEQYFLHKKNIASPQESNGLQRVATKLKIPEQPQDYMLKLLLIPVSKHCCSL